MIQDYINICHDTAQRFRCLSSDDPYIRVLCKRRVDDMQRFARDAEEHLLFERQMKYGKQVHDEK